ncbi:unnamed protein product, partial [Prorocentrum cordatum]
SAFWLQAPASRSFSASGHFGRCVGQQQLLPAPPLVVLAEPEAGGAAMAPRRAAGSSSRALAAAGLAAAGAALLRECAFVPGSARARRAADAPAMEGGAEALAALQVPQV